MTPYEILNIDRFATQEEIKKKYRKLSLRYHPDRNNNSVDANKKFQEITEAYNQIDTQEKRDNLNCFNNSNINKNDLPEELLKFFMQTNNIGKQNVMNNMNNMNDINDINDINIIQNNNTNKDGNSNINMSCLNKPIPIIKKIDITMEQSYTGCNIPIEITRNIFINNTKENETETIYINIHKGIDNNEIIIIREKGNNINNIKGDIKIFISINKHELFTRNGLDLIYKHRLTLKEALCGFTIELPHLNGNVLKINNKKGNIISNDYTKNIEKMGFIRDCYTGNLTIIFIIEFPKKIDSKVINILEKIL
jgi:DnaJ family protein B protein 4